jgi:hypothetical protein
MKRIIKRGRRKLADWCLRVSEFAARMQKKNEDWGKDVMLVLKIMRNGSMRGMKMQIRK